MLSGERGWVLEMESDSVVMEGAVMCFWYGRVFEGVIGLHFLNVEFAGRSFRNLCKSAVGVKSKASFCGCRGNRIKSRCSSRGGKSGAQGVAISKSPVGSGAPRQIPPRAHGSLPPPGQSYGCSAAEGESAIRKSPLLVRPALRDISGIAFPRGGRA